jgi:predicted MFS family arabinose efflux permease
MLGVLRRNPRFRRLWSAQVVSQLGDWFNRVAILTLIGDLSGPDAALGIGALFGVEIALRLLPSTVFGTLAGSIADRISRKLLMISMDLVRALVVLGFLLVREPGDLTLLYVLLVVQMAFSIFFEAARSASTPGTLRSEDLHLAYALTAATWSTMLTIGAVLGGVIVEVVGVRGVFLLDSLTYVVSALVLVGLRLHPMPEQTEALRWRDIVLFRDLGRGLAHVRSLRITPAVFAKTAWGAAGGFLVILGIAGRTRFGDLDIGAAAGGAAGSVGLATGLLYAARGFGTAVGPFLGRRLVGSSDARLKAQIVGGFGVAALGYVLFGFTRDFALALALVSLGHLGGSALWVASTTYWQRHVSDAFRGRVYAMEFMGMTLAVSLGGLATGFLYDATGSLEQTVWFVCAAVVLGGVAWTVSARRLAAGEPPRQPTSPSTR